MEDGVAVEGRIEVAYLQQHLLCNAVSVGALLIMMVAVYIAEVVNDLILLLVDGIAHTDGRFVEHINALGLEHTGMDQCQPSDE